MLSDHSYCRQKGQHIENNPSTQRANLRFCSKLMSCERAWTVIRGGSLKCVSPGSAERAAEVPDLFWSTATKDAGGAAGKKFESKVLWENLVGGKPTDQEQPLAKTSHQEERKREADREEETVQNKEDEPLSSAVSWSATSPLDMKCDNGAASAVWALAVATVRSCRNRSHQACCLCVSCPRGPVHSDLHMSTTRFKPMIRQQLK